MERVLVSSQAFVGGTISSARPLRAPANCCLPLASPSPWIAPTPINNGLADRSGLVTHPKLGFSLNATDGSQDCSPSGNLWDLQADDEVKALVHLRKDKNLPLNNQSDFQTLSKDMAMGLILRAASGTGWTTGSGLEGPSNPFGFTDTENPGSEFPWPTLSKSPRRRMRVAFTCNVCGERTTRAINPHAYTDGTVFVQCGGCNVFHKLVDNLKLFHELKGSVFPGNRVTYGHTDFVEHDPYDFLGLDDFSPL